MTENRMHNYRMRVVVPEGNEFQSMMAISPNVYKWTTVPPDYIIDRLAHGILAAMKKREPDKIEEGSLPSNTTNAANMNYHLMTTTAGAGTGDLVPWYDGEKVHFFPRPQYLDGRTSPYVYIDVPPSFEWLNSPLYPAQLSQAPKTLKEKIQELRDAVRESEEAAGELAALAQDIMLMLDRRRPARINDEGSTQDG